MGTLFGVLGLLVLPNIAFGASLSCTVGDEVPANTTCIGSGYTADDDLEMYYTTGLVENFDNPIGSCYVDVLGEILDCSAMTDIEEEGTFYIFGADMVGVFVTYDENPHVIGSVALAGMDSNSMSAGMATVFGDFSVQYGVIILAIVAIAIGLFGLKFAIAFFFGIGLSGRASGNIRKRRKKRRE